MGPVGEVSEHCCDFLKAAGTGEGLWEGRGKPNILWAVFMVLCRGPQIPYTERVYETGVHIAEVEGQQQPLVQATPPQYSEKVHVFQCLKTHVIGQTDFLSKTHLGKFNITFPQHIFSIL